MKKYTVNVHFDAIATVEVVARSEEEALRKAEDLACEIPASELSFGDGDCESCITDSEDVPNTSTFLKVWQPVINCGYLAGEYPGDWTDNYYSFQGFETEEECKKYIQKGIDEGWFTEQELAGGIYASETAIEYPTIIDAEGEVLKVYQED